MTETVDRTALEAAAAAFAILPGDLNQMHVEDIEELTFGAMAAVTPDDTPDNRVPMTRHQFEGLCSAFGARLTDVPVADTHPHSAFGVSIAAFVSAVVTHAIYDLTYRLGVEDDINIDPCPDWTHPDDPEPGDTPPPGEPSG